MKYLLDVSSNRHDYDPNRKWLSSIFNEYLFFNDLRAIGRIIANFSGKLARTRSSSRLCACQGLTALPSQERSRRSLIGGIGY
jgi:hypothetical protein